MRLFSYFYAIQPLIYAISEQKAGGLTSFFDKRSIAGLPFSQCSAAG